ncbi:MAG: pyrroline-5-carboxylate reductase [Bacteroidota bacterium]|nr:pyrroline-5-carboxylate reductase [Bacteroidota bacterium]
MSKIAIIGCGNMGLTYAKSFLQYNLVKKEHLLLIEKNAELKEHLAPFGNVHNALDSKISEYDTIILSVKPQDAKPVLEELKQYLKPHQMVISIMAGVTISTLEQILNFKSIIRAMPNTPAQLGMGITGFTAGKGTKIQAILKADNLLNATGKTIFLENEDLLNAVTALSGSGPAYFYFIVNAMIEAGVKMGLEENVASLLVKETMNGSFHLMNNSDKTLQELINAVTSKGGTTEAALKKYNEQKLSEVIKDGIFAAENRANELSKLT